MPENVKNAYAQAAKALEKLPEDKQDMAVKLAEAYANGMAAGVELADKAEAEK